MKYVVNQDLVYKYKNIYKNAEKDGKILQCIIGVDSKYRLTVRDSYYSNISDTDTILEYCVYPLYVEGDTKIQDRLESNIKEMLNSNDVLAVFQVFRIVISQEMMKKFYDDLPFEIDFSKIIPTLLDKANILENEMKSYDKNGFNSYKKSIWDNVQKIIRKSSTLNSYDK